MQGNQYHHFSSTEQIAKCKKDFKTKTFQTDFFTKGIHPFQLTKDVDGHEHIVIHFF